MIAFLNTPAGRWAVRLVALPFGWLFATEGLGWTWHGDGHRFLAGLFFTVVLCFALFVSYAVGVVLSFLPRSSASAQKVRHEGPLPQLSRDKQAQVRRLVKTMEAAGIFAPGKPRAEWAFPGVAQWNEPVDFMTVIIALDESPYYFGDEADPASWSENLSFALPPSSSPLPDGREPIFLWEDENVWFSYIEPGQLTALNTGIKPDAQWVALDEKLLVTMRECGLD